MCRMPIDRFRHKAYCMIRTIQQKGSGHEQYAKRHHSVGHKRRDQRQHRQNHRCTRHADRSYGSHPAHQIPGIRHAGCPGRRDGSGLAAGARDSVQRLLFHAGHRTAGIPDFLLPAGRRLPTYQKCQKICLAAGDIRSDIRVPLQFSYMWSNIQYQLSKRIFHPVAGPARPLRFPIF